MVEVKFYFRKEGGSYQQFGSTSSAPSGTVAVDGNQVSDQTKYYFKVELNGATTDETSVIYDVSGPNSVSDYNKETLSSTHIKLTWRNPNDSDFYKVIIYRSTKPQYIADDNTKVAEIVGPRDGVMSWEDAGQEAGKSYYYAIRAVDVAGNGSSLVSDTQATVMGTSTSTDSDANEGSQEIVTQSSNNSGQILGEEDLAEDSGTVDKKQEVSLGDDVQNKETNNTTRYILLAVGILLVVYSGYKFFFKKGN